MTDLVWISESDHLPRVGQMVLFMHPRQAGEFWDIEVKCLLARHEDVMTRAVAAGGQWPTDFHWGNPRSREGTVLVTGNGWWAYMDAIPLPPGAEHRADRGWKNVYQTGDVFIPQSRETSRA